MRNFWIGVLIGLLIAVPIAYTQEQRERIVIAVPLEIGMEKEAVISRIAEQGFVTNKVQGAVQEKESWVITKKNDPSGNNPVGTLMFDKSRLSWASRAWADSTDSGAVKVTRNLYFLLKSFEEHRNTSCSIETTTVDTPNMNNKEVAIHCGKRTALLNVYAMNEKEPIVTVDETIQ
jgi:hypothetical protein